MGCFKKVALGCSGMEVKVEGRTVNQCVVCVCACVCVAVHEGGCVCSKSGKQSSVHMYVVGNAVVVVCVQCGAGKKGYVGAGRTIRPMGNVQTCHVVARRTRVHVQESRVS